MTTVFGYETAGPGCGMFIYREIDELLDELRETIDANSLVPGEIELTVHVLEMTEEQLDSLETLED